MGQVSQSDLKYHEMPFSDEYFEKLYRRGNVLRRECGDGSSTFVMVLKHWKDEELNKHLVDVVVLLDERKGGYEFYAGYVMNAFWPAEYTISSFSAIARHEFAESLRKRS